MKIALTLVVLAGFGSSAFAVTFAEWQTAFFTAAELADPAVSGLGADPDHDARSNYMEFALATHPKISDSPPPLTPDFAPDGRMLLRYIQRTDAPGLLVLPQVTTDLAGGKWLSGRRYLPAIGLLAAAPGSVEVTIMDLSLYGSLETRFVRLLITEDVNNNGVPDSWETAHGLSLNDPAAVHRDSDGDGWSDGQELLDGTDPFEYYNHQQPPGPPSAPTHFKVYRLPDGGRWFTWDDTSDNETYFVIRDTLPDGSVVEVGRVGPNETSFYAPPPAP